MGLLAGLGGFGFLGPFGLGGFGAFFGAGGGWGFCSSTPAVFTGSGTVIAGTAATAIRKAIARISVFMGFNFFWRIPHKDNNSGFRNEKIPMVGNKMSQRLKEM